MGADQSLYSGEHPQLNNRKSVCQKKKRKNYGLMCPPNIYGTFNSEGKGVGSPWIVFFFTFYHKYPHVFQTRGLTEFFICFSEARLLRSLRFHSWLLHHFCCCKLYSSSLPTSGSRLGDPRNYWLSERHQDKRHF